MNYDTVLYSGGWVSAFQ